MPRFEKIPRPNWKHTNGMRRNPTEAEAALWSALRNRQLGVKFLRQHPIGPFIVDFYSHQVKLVIELDGEPHTTKEGHERDEGKIEYFALQGIMVKHYWNHEVLTDLAKVVRDLRDLVEQRLTVKCNWV